jgi:Fe-S-cluster containining protein
MISPRRCYSAGVACDRGEPSWYDAGLHFACTACGDCCSGEPGVVWLNDAEIDALAALLGLDQAELARRYMRLVGGKRALLERFDGDCIFLDAGSRRCTVYPARPVQCRTFPFWNEHLQSPEAWAAVAAACPGVGRGELHPADELRARARERARARAGALSRRSLQRIQNGCRGGVYPRPSG